MSRRARQRLQQRRTGNGRIAAAVLDQVALVFVDSANTVRAFKTAADDAIDQADTAAVAEKAAAMPGFVAV